MFEVGGENFDVPPAVAFERTQLLFDGANFLLQVAERGFVRVDFLQDVREFEDEFRDCLRLVSHKVSSLVGDELEDNAVFAFADFGVGHEVDRVVAVVVFGGVRHVGTVGTAEDAIGNEVVEHAGKSRSYGSAETRFDGRNFASRNFNVDEEQIAAVNSRLSQVETNLANLYLQLSTEKDLGLTPNLMLAEDFTGESVCDMFSQIVMGATQNTRVITLDNGTGLIAGSYYTLTDGVNSEEVQIVSIATNNGVTTVNVASNIQNNYSLANTTLRRSTLTVGDGQAYGAGDIRSETFTFTRVWTGTAANNTATITLATTLANQAAFDLEGDYAFTSDGEFTLAS